MKKKLNLNLLENADNETIKILSEQYPPVDEEEFLRLFDKTEKIYKERTEKSENYITVVSKSKMNIWFKILATVSALLVVTVIGIRLETMKNSESPSSAFPDNTEQKNPVLEISAPFGDISGDKVRCMAPAYAPYLLDITDDVVEKLAFDFNFAKWEKADINTPRPDGEAYSVFVYNDGQPFRLIFYSDYTVDYEKDGDISKYSISDEVYNTVCSAVQPENSSLLSSNLIPCKIEDVTAEGVWKNNEPVPEKIFEIPAVPDEFKEKTIIEKILVYNLPCDFDKIENIAKNSENIITGTVESLSYRPSGNYETGRNAETIISITVSDDANGIVSPGERVEIITAGGYISARDMIEVSDEDVLSDENIDIDNTCYKMMAISEEKPMLGKEYAFFVASRDNGEYSAVGVEYGILYKCDNLFIQKNSAGYNFFDINDLMGMLRDVE